MKHLIHLCAALALLFPAQAEDSDAKTAAVEAMQAWLKVIDSGGYAKSWSESAKSFQSAISSENWVSALGVARKPLGACESRTLASALYQTEIPAPDGTLQKGDYVIAQFDSSFANLKYAVETVTFERQDGAWKASGYFIKPK